MDLQLGSPDWVLMDGNISWNTVAENALATWNLYMNRVQFTVYTQSTGIAVNGNERNEVQFNSRVYGQSFGSGVLAMTTTWVIGTRRTEGDTIFNSTVLWDSYRGNVKFTIWGEIVNDLQRVALHEFGHTLGLDHPDQAGQSVGALMNSHIGNLDRLTTDDTAGAAALYYRVPPSITTQPQSRTVTVGSSVTFSVAASGSQPLYYQWRRNGVSISGATVATYTISNVQTSQAGNYTVVVSNSAGSVTSATAALTVNVPPSITAQPQSQTVAAGNNVTFTVTATGTSPLSYQWYRNNSTIAGASSASHTISGVQPSDADGYKARVSNAAGSVESAVATLTVQYAPVITAQPQSQTVNVGANATFSVVATGNPAPTYQWRFNGANISGATASSYSRNNVQPTDAGSYTVVVSNVAGSATSTTAALTVNIPPSITTQPVSRVVSAGNGASFTVAATGTSPLSYQWYHNNSTIAGATASTYPLPSAQPSDAGDYKARVSNSAGSVDSAAATLTVQYAPVITSQPRNQAVIAGNVATFSVTANAVPSPTYQWRFKGQDLANATGSSLTLSNTSVANVGDYLVIVSNAIGSIASSPASLIIPVPPTNSYVEVIKADGPVAYWRLGESSGVTAGDEIDTNDGTYLNGVSLAVPGIIATYTNTAARFSSADRHKIDVPLSGVLNPPQFTAEVWARVTGGAGNYRSPLTSRAEVPTKRGYIFYAEPGNTWQFWSGRGDSNVWDNIPGPSLEANRWTHLVATYDGTTKRFYVNGAEVGSSTAAFAVNDQNVLRIGGGATEGDGNYFFEGDVDEAAIYNQALTQEQIVLHYLAGTVALNSLRFDGIDTLTNGDVLLNVSGPAGKNVTIFASPDLLNWLPIVTLPNPQGTVQFTNTSAGSFTRRFYKAVAE